MSTLRALAKFYDGEHKRLINDFPFVTSIAQKEIFENAYKIITGE